MTAEVVRLSEAAEAIGDTPRNIKSLFEHYDLDRGIAPAGRWKAFDYGAIAVLAITVVLVKAGFLRAFAFELARNIVRKRWPELFEGAQVWKVHGIGQEMLVLRNGTWAWNIDQVDISDGTPCDALLMLDAPGIIERAFARLRHRKAPVRIDVRTGKKKR
jgi:hypothetical protein